MSFLYKLPTEFTARICYQQNVCVLTYSVVRVHQLLLIDSGGKDVIEDPLFTALLTVCEM